MEASNPTDFTLTKVIIYPNGDKEPRPITALVNTFEYVENITHPFLSAKMEVVDSAGLLTTLPIQGGEKIVVEVDAKAFKKKMEYEFVIWTIQNRFARQQKQSYDIGLISMEALVNEITRVNQPLSGNPENIIAKLLNERLKTTKTIFGEPSKFEVKMVANYMRTFDIIAEIATKSVSAQTNYNSTNNQNNNKSEQQVKGSAGFFFWESKRGYNFFAVDSLCADQDSKLKSKNLDSPPWGQYVETLGNQEGIDTRFQILESNFESEIDLLSSLRHGKYSSMLVFFNHSTGQYEEYVYKIKDSYDNMAHLGGQEGITLIPTNQIELSDYPSRIMSVFLDHESWYNEATPASPDPKDGATDPTKFADWQKYYTAQSLARFQLLKNQMCTIVIAGNPDICAGDKIDIRLVNKVGTVEGRKEPYDPESSGVYLISEVAHFYDTTNGPGGKFTTTLRLMRDSYGLKDRPSNHGTK
tara:strand:- start:6558 stop:7967 length:1410 start_codon:yes stop_codon:yes gene_type:complete